MRSLLGTAYFSGSEAEDALDDGGEDEEDGKGGVGGWLCMGRWMD